MARVARWRGGRCSCRWLSGLCCGGRRRCRRGLGVTTSFEYSTNANVNGCSGPSLVILTFATIVVAASFDGRWSPFNVASSVLPSRDRRSGKVATSFGAFVAGIDRLEHDAAAERLRVDRLRVVVVEIRAELSRRRGKSPPGGATYPPPCRRARRAAGCDPRGRESASPVRGPNHPHTCRDPSASDPDSACMSSGA